jgi:DMSO/TMAO reductase YedYZ molybdopterin-dependent catalytic subunit
MIATAPAVIRSIPLAKALDENTLIAWDMNGAPLPKVHGFPLRLVVPGWVGSASTKWLATLTALDAPFKGTYMTASYVQPKWPVEPGQKMPPDTVSTEAWPVKSMITSPAPNARFKGTDRIVVRGRAWVGEGSIDRVEVSSDEGRTVAAGDARARGRSLRVAHVHVRVSAAALRLPDVPRTRMGRPRQCAADGVGLESARIFLERRASSRSDSWGVGSPARRSP